MKAYLALRDDQEIRLAINGKKYFGCLWDTYQTLRQWAKHGIGDKDFEDCCRQLMSEMSETVDLEEIE